MKKIISFIVSVFLPAQAFCDIAVYAHRGDWKHPDAVENSIASLRHAHENGYDGSEMDVYITLDGIVVVSHESGLWGREIEFVNYSDISKTVMANGEPLPTFEEYLKAHKELCGKYGAKTKLILELKPHKNQTNEQRCVEKSVELIKKYGLENNVNFVSFSKFMCSRVLSLLPEATIFYLGMNLDINDIKKMGIGGFDSLSEQIMLDQTIIKRAHKAGLKIGVWFMSDEREEEKIQQLIKKNIDFITTNNPEKIRRLILESEKSNQ